MKKELFILLGVLVLINCISNVSAWSNDTFNQSGQETEILRFTTAGSFMRYLSVPQNIILSSAFMNLTYPIGFSNSGVVAYYNFDETTGRVLIDQQQGANNGTSTNVTINVPGKKNKAYWFNGYNTTVIMNNTASNNLNFSRNFTIAFWFNQTTPTPQYILSKVPSGTGEFRMDLNDSGFFKMLFWNNTGGVFSLSGNTTTTRSLWHFYAVTFNGTLASYYLDSNLMNTTQYTGNIQETVNNLTIGYDQTLGQYSNGTMDELWIYNRGLSASEIGGLYLHTNSTPSNINLSIGGSNAQNIEVSNVTTAQNTTIRTSNLNVFVNTYLASCTYVGGYCLVPFNFSSNVAGVFIQYGNLTFNDLGVAENNQTFNTSTYETAYENFRFNFTYGSGVTLSSANLHYAGVTYAGTILSDSGGQAVVSRSIDIPLGVTTNSFYWDAVLNNGTTNNYFNSSTQSQIVSESYFSLCQTNNTVKYINFTFKNETAAQETVNATWTSTFLYWLGTGTKNKSFGYSTSTLNQNYTFCYSPSTRSVTILPSIQYVNTESPQRTYSTQLTLSNATTNTVLYLLPNYIGSQVSFQVVNLANQVVIGALVTVTSSTYGTQSALTDGSGVVTFFLNPLVSYTVAISADGYQSFSTSIFPTQSQYTFRIQQFATSNLTDNLAGITFNYAPILPYLDNGTTYNFNFTTIVSQYTTLSSFGFTLDNVSTTLGSVSSTSPTGGTVSLSADTGNSSTINMNYFYVVNGSIANGTVTWTVQSTYGTSWSLKTFFSDLSTYANGGIFGLTRFGLALIVFFTIFLFAGALSYKFGLESPTIIAWVVFFLVAMFDWAGLIPFNGFAAHAATSATLIICISLTIWEATR